MTCLHKIQETQDTRYTRYKRYKRHKIQETQDTKDTRYKRHKIQKTQDTKDTRYKTQDTWYKKQEKFSNILDFFLKYKFIGQRLCRCFMLYYRIILFLFFTMYDHFNALPHSHGGKKRDRREHKYEYRKKSIIQKDLGIPLVYNHHQPVLYGHVPALERPAHSRGEVSPPLI